MIYDLEPTIQLPNEEDIAEAESAYAAFQGRFGWKHKRADYVAALAQAAMHKRRNNEYKAAIKRIKELQL